MKYQIALQTQYLSKNYLIPLGLMQLATVQISPYRTKRAKESVPWEQRLSYREIEVQKLKCFKHQPWEMSAHAEVLQMIPGGVGVHGFDVVRCSWEVGAGSGTAE